MEETRFDREKVSWGSRVALSQGGVDFFRNTLVRILFGGNLLALSASIAILAYFIRPTENPIVLHYNVYFGVDLLGAWWQVYALPAAAAIALFGHLFLARGFYYRTERIAAYLLLLGSGMFSAGVLIASSAIAFVNY